MCHRITQIRGDSDLYSQMTVLWRRIWVSESVMAPSPTPQQAAVGDRPPPNVAATGARRAALADRIHTARAAAVGAVGSGMLAIAALVIVGAVLIALLIALAVLLRDVGANPSNTIVHGLHQGANFFAGAFTGLLTFRSHFKRELTVDWGIASVLYLLAGALLATLIARTGRRMRPAVAPPAERPASKRPADRPGPIAQRPVSDRPADL
jgi:hypothetical protein